MAAVANYASLGPRFDYLIFGIRAHRTDLQVDA